MKYITTPIYYVNAEPHVGHAVTTLAADVLARFWRLKGDQTFFLTGTDEHGAKIAEAAQKANKEPLAFADEVSAQFKSAWRELTITPDGFIRTTDPKHEAFVKQFLQDLYDKGVIYKGSYKGWYCVGCEEFKTDNQIGEGNTCPIHLLPLTELEEESYQFKLSEYQDQIVNLIESDTLKILPVARKNEVLSFIKSEGLRDVAISRKNVEWGIAVPWDETHSIYVWIDALLNYLSATDDNGPDFENGRPEWAPTLQLIGKDILRFHAVIWPGLLLAAGKELPKELFVHGFFTVEGQKMSKSLGNVLKPADLIARYGVDGTRYLLLTAIPFGGDGDLSIGRLDVLYNSSLANNLGNLVNRVQSMISRYKDGVVPQVEQGVLDALLPHFEKFNQRFTAEDLSWQLNTLNVFVDKLNELIEESKPWSLAKDNDPKLDNVLAELAEKLFVLGVLLQPFVPHTSDQILSLFGTSVSEVDYDTLGKNAQVGGKKIAPIDPLFPRLDLFRSE